MSIELMSIELISLETIQEIAKDYGYWTVFLGIMLENVGLPIPGETVTLVGGFLSGSDELNYWWVLGSAIAGSTLGGNLGYWLGRIGGWSLVTNVGQFFRLKPEKLEQVRDQFSNNAVQAVFVGRFIAVLRVLASPLAGIAQMPYPRFFLWNFAGATVWASATVTAAYFAGKMISLEQLLQWVSRFTFVAVAIVALWIGVNYWLEHRPASATPFKLTFPKVVLPKFIRQFREQD
jgi:membrane protein DedA with SNARE-associated domain